MRHLDQSEHRGHRMLQRPRNVAGAQPGAEEQGGERSPVPFSATGSRGVRQSQLVPALWARMPSSAGSSSARLVQTTIFGNDALALKAGRIALAVRDRKPAVIRLEDAKAPPAP